MGPLIPLFWTSGDVSPGFQSQGGYPRLHALSPACNEFPRFTSGAIPADLSANQVTLTAKISSVQGETLKRYLFGNRKKLSENFFLVDNTNESN